MSCLWVHLISDTIDRVPPPPGGDNTDGRQPGGRGSLRRDLVVVKRHLVETGANWESEDRKKKTSKVVWQEDECFHQRPLQSRKKITKKETKTKTFDMKKIQRFKSNSQEFSQSLPHPHVLPLLPSTGGRRHSVPMCKSPKTSFLSLFVPAVLETSRSSSRWRKHLHWRNRVFEDAGFRWNMLCATELMMEDDISQKKSKRSPAETSSGSYRVTAQQAVGDGKHPIYLPSFVKLQKHEYESGVQYWTNTNLKVPVWKSGIGQLLIQISIWLPDNISKSILS